MTKLLKEYTAQEIESLTDDQIELIIKYECLEEGVKLLPVAMPTKPINSIPEPNIDVYSINGILDYSTIYVNNFEDACKLKKCLESIDWGHLKYSNNYTHSYYISNKKPIDIKSQKSFTVSKYQEYESNIKNFEKETSRYNKTLEDYEKTLKDQEHISSDVWDTVYKCRDHKLIRDDLIKEFNEYIKLIGDDCSKTLALFQKAYPDCQNYFVVDEDNAIKEIYLDVTQD